ncbi:MAG: N-acetyltransferase [Deltaproteobacteria bacterium]|nr:N-acetyltransferase [Deltaproteobacteria bacterium]MBN2846333.1 N-acetyltransferase [Deltaproteobacteria bacterium]
MQIRETTIDDAENIKEVYLQAFDNSEAHIISDFAINLLNENHPVEIISLVAIENDEIVGHTALSPVFLENTYEHFGYILAPLAVSPKFQNNKIGSSLIKYGLDAIANRGAFIVFVYGDHKYYSRFGFELDLAKNFIPPYTLKFPEGWHALKINSADFPEGGTLNCVDSLNDPNLW